MNASLDWTSLKDLPNGEHPQGATFDYVVSRSMNSQDVLVRNGDASELLFTYSAPAGFTVNQVFLEPPTLVVVTADPVEEQDDRVVAIDLRTHAERGLADGAPEIWKGSWSLREDTLTYGARGPGGRYCLAAADLATMDGDLVECVPPRHGVSQVRQSPYGLAYSRFDDSRPMSCGTTRIQRESAEPVDAEGPADCKAWDAVLIQRGGLVWDEVPHPRRIEEAEVFARTAATGTESLGDGTTGSLTWCGDYAWFLSQVDGRIMRWSPDGGLEVAFQMPDPSKAAVLSAPICSGTTVAFMEASDAPGPGNREVLYRTQARS